MANKVMMMAGGVDLLTMRETTYLNNLDLLWFGWAAAVISKSTIIKAIFGQPAEKMYSETRSRGGGCKE